MDSQNSNLNVSQSLKNIYKTGDIGSTVLQLLVNENRRGKGKFSWSDIYAARVVQDFAAAHLSEQGDEQVNLETVTIIASVLILALRDGRTYLSLCELCSRAADDFSALDVSLSDVFNSAESLVSFIRGLPAIFSKREPEEVVDLIELGELPRNQSPLSIQGENLYLVHYWYLHQRLDAFVWERAKRETPVPSDTINQYFQHLYHLDSPKEPAKTSEIDAQALAGAMSLLNPFLVVSGGPGTGKTTTVSSLLWIAIAQAVVQKQRDFNVRFLAPTGKAALRLSNEVRLSIGKINERMREVSSAHAETIRKVIDSLPQIGQTVHRYLYTVGNQNRSGGVIQNQGSKASVDLLIVDETSMVDLNMMVTLLESLPKSCRVVFLGDHNQLPSIEPGSVLQDWYKRFSKMQYPLSQLSMLSRITNYAPSVLAEHLKQHCEEDSAEAGLPFNPFVYLHHTYRFSGALKQAADLVLSDAKDMQEQKSRLLIALGQQQTEFKYRALDAQTLNALVGEIAQKFNAFIEHGRDKTPAEATALFDQYRILCSTREGPLGSVQLNKYVEQSLGFSSNSFYRGKPILVTLNHHHLGLSNGDVGFIVEPHDDSAGFQVAFPGVQETLLVPLSRLKQFETAYVMTVHKSQGSEFKSVDIILPDYAQEVLSDKLIYTAITRAKIDAQIWASSSALSKALDH